MGATRARRMAVAGAVGLMAVGAAMAPAIVSAQPAGQTALQVTPSSDLVGGQTVVVDGQGFVIGGEHQVLQCVRGAADTVVGSLDLSRCDPSTGVLTTADGDGVLSVPFSVAATITVGGSDVDCVVIGACEIVAHFATNDGPPVGAVAIEFTGAVAPTTTTAPTTPVGVQPSFTG